MKLKRLRFLALILVVLGLFVVFFTDLVKVADFLPKVRLQRTTMHTSSAVTLEAVRDIYAFNTVEYVHRAVFPYDYLAADIDLNRILSKIRSGDSTVAQSLEPEEYLYFRAYNLAQEVGMDPGSEREFLVVTIVVTAGFDLEGTAMVNSAEPIDSNDADGAFRVELYDEDGTSKRRVFVPAPTAVVTDVQIEDIVTENYPYPDVSISANDWRRVAEFVRDQVENFPEIEDLLNIATTNGEEFVGEILMRSGFDEVVFE